MMRVSQMTAIEGHNLLRSERRPAERDRVLEVVIEWAIAPEGLGQVRAYLGGEGIVAAWVRAEVSCGEVRVAVEGKRAGEWEAGEGAERTVFRLAGAEVKCEWDETGGVMNVDVATKGWLASLCVGNGDDAEEGWELLYARLGEEVMREAGLRGAWVERPSVRGCRAGKSKRG